MKDLMKTTMMAMIAASALLMAATTASAQSGSCSTNSRGYEFSGWSEHEVVSECKRHPRTSNSQCEVNVYCSQGGGFNPGHGGGGFNPGHGGQGSWLGYTLFKTVHGPQVYLSQGDGTYCHIDTMEKLNRFLQTYTGQVPAPVFDSVPAGLQYRGICWL